ncbi:HAD-IIA family hydrolase [Nocardioides nitrophenolicus]|uniref:HAD-IIA family hydrolase n=1 Tax=Nocardioides nitrophenolicus TaxID=60489 RepID=UPI0027DCB292|nr:HAD-IIA family hydrolase [Nocardioides nitrophenolicus]MBM7515101.1 HAD superfamily hydrolase (TIGR01450 family) [Nocardioides nitrophenolicus]
MLLTSADALTGAYDLAMLDLDGVVYIGREAVPGAAGHIAGAREAGMRVAFITNNASRSAAVVAEHLRELGVTARTEDVVTSAQAAARLLVERFGPGARVLCLGGPGLESALEEAGLVPVAVEADAVAAVSGYGPDLRWHEIMRAAVRVRDGLPWVASNTDLTIPTSYGTAPGHGVLVEMMERYTGVTPQVAGKPARPLLDETVRRVGGRRPLMVGDRLDTDIEGARNAGVDSLLVLTGVTGLAELVAARPGERPSYLARDLGGLSVAHQAPERVPDGWRLGGWLGRVEDGRLVVEPVRSGPDDQASLSVDDWWRVAAVAAWQHQDETGAVPDIGAARVPGTGSGAR